VSLVIIFPVLKSTKNMHMSLKICNLNIITIGLVVLLLGLILESLQIVGEDWLLVLSRAMQVI
jgi:hypothetical protein